MNKLKSYWKIWREKSGSLGRWLMIPTVCYLELLFHYWIGAEFTPSLLFALLGFGLCLGGLLNLIAAALPRKASRWFTGVAIFLCTTVMMVELLIGDAYFNFMRPTLVFATAGGVITDFADVMIDMIINNLWRIAIALLPLWLLLLSGKNERYQKKRCLTVSAAVTLAGTILGFVALNVSAQGLGNVIPQYNFNNSMKRNGITVSMFMELTGLADQGNSLEAEAFDFEPEEFLAVPTTAATESATNAATEPTTKAATEPTTKATTEPTIKETTEPTTKATTEPTVKETTEPTTKATTEPTTKAATEPTTKATTEPTTKAATEPTVKETTEPTTKATTEPTTKETTEPTTKATTEPTTEPTTEAVTEPVPEETEPKVYKPHVIEGLDFGELAEIDTDSTRRKLFSYMDAQSPALENEYTGLFEGKNLIMICAESFNYAIIDPELTPTLYRLTTQGIHFTNAYVPLWSGSTSGGELALFSGLAMNCEMGFFSSQKPFNTISRQLMNQGYFSRAYHNNLFTYYDRHLTHENLGYEKYIGMGNGLEKGVKDVWPASDQEMFEFTIPQYIDQQPFSVYYMTVSGHSRYNFYGNAQSKKNQELVQDLPYSEPLKAYLAANLEVEKGLATLVEQLEEAGIADDTVIVLTADHFPYGLGTAWGNDHNCQAELYGVDKYDQIDRDRNSLIIWSGCLEGKGIQVDAPVCSLDVLPTLSNLFGVEYDSRMTVGRDALGTEEAIVPWPDYSWVTELGKFEASTNKFTAFVEESQIPEGYVDRISTIVRNRVNFSRSVQGCQFYLTIQNYLAKK